MWTTFYTLTIFLALNVLYADATKVSACDEGKMPEIVDIGGCEDPPCLFYIEANNSMTFKFRSPSYLENIENQATANVEGLIVPYPFLNPKDSCQCITNTPCPIVEEEYVEFTFSMYISALIPEQALELQFAVYDKDLKKNALCVKFNIQTSRQKKL